VETPVAVPAAERPWYPPPSPKLLEWDYSVGLGDIKVLSRTLFVTGISSEAHLCSLFNQFGAVQTCIVNINKRHAFIKMISRQDAMSAREGIESFRSGELQLRTRWGLGFGPRDCSNYQTGISVIPIERLTDADRKWLLTAEYGGTGGRPIVSGMVVEEPDIEIGAGVSSNALRLALTASVAGSYTALAAAVAADVQTVMALAVPAMAGFAAIDRQEYQLEADR
jgi:protein NRD1